MSLKDEGWQFLAALQKQHNGPELEIVHAERDEVWINLVPPEDLGPDSAKRAEDLVSGLHWRDGDGAWVVFV